MRPALVMSCSSVKRAIAAGDRVPFAELYDGPTWRQLHASGFPLDRVAAISAEHGFMAPGEKIATYDRAMDEKRSAMFCEYGGGMSAIHFREFVLAAGAAFVVGGALYQELARVAIRRFPELAELVTFAHGSYLEQRKQLGEFLRAHAPSSPALELTPAGVQSVLPGADRDPAGLARRMAAAPIKPAAAQKPCDVGLFSDASKQLTFI